FDSLNPQQAHLIAALKAAGCEVVEEVTPAEPGRLHRLSLPDPEAECLAAACWARARLAENPQARLAIVSPRLEAIRAPLARALGQVLDPGGWIATARQPPFNLSLGHPLAEYPLVAQLLLALRLCLSRPLELNEIGVLLRSPFLAGHAEEWGARAAFDRDLRRQGRPRLSRRQLLRRLRQQQRKGPSWCPRLIERLEALEALLQTLPREASPNAWSGHLLRLCEVLGWPGEAPLDSAEYQQAARLREAISEFATLSRIHRQWSLPEALEQFTRLCEEIDFQPQRPAARLQVLGMLEAAGLRFDGLWLLGMDDRAWPPAPAPNPLLPFPLQQELDMPHASAARELAFARQLGARLFAAADEVWISHARAEDDRELRPSPLIAEVPAATEETLDFLAANPLYRTACQATALEDLPLPDHLPPPAAPRGGTGLIADQSACPFRAAARHRLAAEGLAEAEYSPSPRLLGEMVHQLLDRTWAALRDSTTLHAHDEQALEELLRRLARQTLDDLGRARPDLFEGRLAELEQERLTALGLRWLTLEKARPRPFRVTQREERSNVELGGLVLRVRADRIDTLEDGSRLVIDYKTGNRVDAGGWTEERLREPQVPLYAITQERLAGALLAQVHRTRQRFVGTTAEAEIVPQVDAYQGSDPIPDWDALLHHWRQALQALAEEILAGRAQVAPRDAEACRYCELPGLCRVDIHLEDGEAAP
ncbi:MAG: PD-(D/E)XK nuclease family protein, partial [Gammaproteobacteria bacterium]